MTTAAVDPPVALRLEDVFKRYRHGPPVLDGIELEVRRGSFTSLLGPSGCGKSTLLRMLAGLSRPSRGRIVWLDSPALSLVPQEPTLMPWRRVADNVRLPLQLAGVPRRRSRDAVAAALEAVGLGGVADAYPRQLSGGMRMRVSIARALVSEPSVLLMDEPFAALDEVTRDRLNDDLLALVARRRLTVVFVTHSVAEAVRLSSRIVVLAPAPGRIHLDLENGPLREGPGAARRGDPAFLRACARVSEALREAGPRRAGEPAP